MFVVCEYCVTNFGIHILILRNTCNNKVVNKYTLYFTGLKLYTCWYASQGQNIRAQDFVVYFFSIKEEAMSKTCVRELTVLPNYWQGVQLEVCFLKDLFKWPLQLTLYSIHTSNPKDTPTCLLIFLKLGWGQSAKLQQLVDHFPSDQWKALFLLPLDQWQASIYSMIE